MKEKKELEEQFKKAQKPWSKLYEKVKLNHITIIQGVPITWELWTNTNSSLLRISFVLPNFNGHEKVTSARIYFMENVIGRVLFVLFFCITYYDIYV